MGKQFRTYLILLVAAAAQEGLAAPAAGNYAVFQELPLGSMQPRGWLKTWLEDQRDGITGHLHKYNEIPFGESFWFSDRMLNAPEGGPATGHGTDKRWWGYEQTGYWLDGTVRCGHLLGDERLINLFRERMEFVLDHAGEDGFLGPRWVEFTWPSAVFFRAWMAEYSATGERRIVDALARHYLATRDMYAMGDPKGRSFAVLNTVAAENLCWLYGQTGNRTFLDMAESSYRSIASGKPTSQQGLMSGHAGHEHGVIYVETLKTPAILYAHTGKREYLDAAINGFTKLDEEHGLICGIHSSAENLQGNDFHAAAEVCNASAYPWTAGYLLMASGDPAWADRIERACFNAGIGAVTKDFRAHQYFTKPNQVVSDRNSWLNVADGKYTDRLSWWVKNGRNAYSPSHNVQCCTGNINRFMPNYVGRMWLNDREGNPVAATYGPCQVKLRTGRDRIPVSIVEETDYPFSDKIVFHVDPETPVEFSLKMRIPAWCENPTVTINGEEPFGVETGTFSSVRRTFRAGDTVSLHLPAPVELSPWPRGGVGVERGPLVYALPVKAQKNKVKDPGMIGMWRIKPDKAEEFPACEMEPRSEWSYALAVDEDAIRGIRPDVAPMSDAPWNDEVIPPLSLRVPARRVQNWGLESVQVGDRNVSTTPASLPAAPRLSDKVEEITLVPYGATLLRLSIFPRAE